MATPLVSMKLLRPALHAGCVPRLHLMQRLEQALYCGHRLVLVSAPAGFGKTTLLSAWAEWMADPAAPHLPGFLPDTPPLFAWLALDPEDNHPDRFWDYVAAAVQAAQPAPGMRELASAAGSDAARAPAMRLLGLLSGLSSPLVLILDDYHVVTAPAVHAGLTQLIEHLPPNLQIVLATREDPPLPVGRLRAQGQLTELRTDDLRFTPGEAATFLNVRAGLTLSPEDIRALAARTEGWVAGLQLAATALANGCADPHAFVATFSGSHRYVLEYLLEEVYSRQSEPVQRFLLATSILERLCAPLCAAVTGDADAGTRLADLERANAFVSPLDEERHWYRFHHLFADLLRDRLRRETGADAVAALHRRASEWYESHDAREDAVRHALAAGDFARVAVLVERLADPVTLPEALWRLRRWLAVLPQSALDGRPRLRLWAAWLAYAEGRLAGIAETLGSLVAALDSVSGSRAGEGLDAQVAASLALWSALTGEAVRAIGDAQTALAVLPPGESAVRAWATYALALAQLEFGDLDDAARSAFAARHSALAAGNLFVAARALSLQGRVAFRQGHLDESTQLYAQALAAGGSPSSGPAVLDSHLGLAEVRLSQRDYRGAAAALAQAAQASPPGCFACDAFRLAVLQCALCRARGDLAGAVTALRAARGSFTPGESLASLIVDPIDPDSVAVQVDALCCDAEIPGPLRAYAERWLVDGRATQSVGSGAGDLVEPLSTREREVLRLVAAGRSNAQIAGDLSVTQHTVKKHLSNIFGKLGVTSRTQAVARAREIGLD